MTPEEKSQEEEKFENLMFKFLKENLTLDIENSYDGYKYIYLLLTNPATGQKEKIGYNYLMIKEGEGYY